MIKVEILLDSINVANDSRITTWVLEYPRFVHSEFLTHRMFSKNSASSRAIPFEKFVEQITTNPALPVFWGKNQSGMQAVEELSNEYEDATSYYSNLLTPRQRVETYWLEARDEAIKQATRLNSMGCHKQIVNRILEPWFHIRVIMTATEISNFFALRAHKDAQPEIAALASLMLEKYNESTPQRLNPGEWHIPFGDKLDIVRLEETYLKINNLLHIEANHSYFAELEELKKKIAVARCARVSYYNFDGKDDYAADIKLCDRLFGSTPRHLSPAEHVAQAAEEDKYIGNFRGFKQYRKYFIDENLKDDRIIKK